MTLLKFNSCRQIRVISMQLKVFPVPPSPISILRHALSFWIDRRTQLAMSFCWEDKLGSTEKHNHDIKWGTITYSCSNKEFKLSSLDRSSNFKSRDRFLVSAMFRLYVSTEVLVPDCGSKPLTSFQRFWKSRFVKIASSDISLYVDKKN